jgi:uncharacterized RDD family membrane protein YckC
VFRDRYAGLWEAPAVAEATEITAYGDRASYGRRLVAFLIDIAACGLIALAFGRPSGTRNLIGDGIFYVEVTVLTALTGHSFGHRVAGLRVLRLDGRPVGFVRALVRTTLLVLVIPVFLVSRDGRGLHDRAAGTAIVRA